jgi:mevalonate kinase
MVLPEYEALWKMGLESDNFYLKLCGAGGGGFILGFTPNINETTKLLDEHNIKIIEV